MFFVIHNANIGESEMNTSRREFIRILLGASALALFFIIGKPAEARQRSLADFLENFDAVYDPNQEWGFGPGRLLRGVNGQSGNLLIYVDDAWVSRSVDSIVFDPNHQRLRIMRGNQRIFDYDPRLCTAPQPLH